MWNKLADNLTEHVDTANRLSNMRNPKYDSLYPSTMLHCVIVHDLYRLLMVFSTLRSSLKLCFMFFLGKYKCPVLEFLTGTGYYNY